MASFSVSCPKSSALLPVGSRPHGSQQQQQTFWKISFPASRLRSSFLAGFSLDQSLFFRFQWPGQNHSALWKVHGLQHEVAAEKSSNSAPVPKAKMGVPLSGGKDDQTEEPTLQNAVPDPASISAFLAQVVDLVKLVDSKDIMELQLKQLDCELIIRKKAALPQTPIGPPFVMMQQPPPQAILPSQPQPVQATAPAPSAPVQAVSAPASKSSHSPLKCPMAGTFYRSSAPGEPPFVKVGDKVQKGQVLCIIEAMKLMNEIEADQSGTIVEILVEDGKPVSVDMPLFSIEP